jgi:hypothetical protein
MLSSRFHGDYYYDHYYSTVNIAWPLYVVIGSTTAVITELYHIYSMVGKNNLFLAQIIKFLKTYIYNNLENFIYLEANKWC